jgi:NADH-quinone oxidoreductase subunit M
MISEFGGLWRQMPRYSVCFLVVMLASIGLPGLNGFVGEFLILLGSYETLPVQTAIAVSGVILGAAYMLRMYQRVMFGELDIDKNGELEDMKPAEIAIMAPIVALIVIMGVYPAPFTETMAVSIEATLEVSDSPTAYALTRASSPRSPAHFEDGAPGFESDSACASSSDGEKGLVVAGCGFADESPASFGTFRQVSLGRSSGVGR